MVRKGEENYTPNSDANLGSCQICVVCSTKSKSERKTQCQEGDLPEHADPLTDVVPHTDPFFHQQGLWVHNTAYELHVGGVVVLDGKVLTMGCGTGDRRMKQLHSPPAERPGSDPDRRSLQSRWDGHQTVSPHMSVWGRAWCMESSHSDGDHLDDDPDPLADVVGHVGLVDARRFLIAHVVDMGNADSG